MTSFRLLAGASDDHTHGTVEKPSDSQTRTYGGRSGEDRTGAPPYWPIIRQHKLLVCLAAALGAMLAFFVTSLQKPVYRASASIEIQGINENFLNMRELSPNTTVRYTDDIQTQVRMLQSRSLLRRVVQRLKSENRSGVAEGRVSKNRDPLDFGRFTPISPEAALEAAAANIKVKSSMNTRIVEILCDSTSPKLAAEFANGVSNEYIEQNRRNRWEATQKTSKWLEGQMRDVAVKLEKSEKSLQTYARAAGLLFTGDEERKGIQAEEGLRRLEEELLKAQTESIGKQARSESTTLASEGSLPAVVDDESLREYKSKLVDLRRQLAEATVTLKATHPQVQRLQAQIQELDSALQRSRAEFVNRTRHEFRSAEHRENLLAADVARQRVLVNQQKERAIHYNTLKREVDTNRQLYESMLQRAKEAQLASALQASEVRVLDPAEPPSQPYKPNLATNFLFGSLGGAFLGCMFVVKRELHNPTVQQPGDVRSYLNLPELGVIVSAKTERRLTGLRTTGSSIPDSAEPGTWTQNPSLLAEGIRATATSIMFSAGKANGARVCVLTSAHAKAGKTSLAVNLAIAFAEINSRVLLIDADMRRPRIHQLLGLENRFGLSNLLSLDKLPVSPILSTEIPGLFVLPSGPPVDAGFNLVHSPRVSELLTQFRTEYDAVVIDTPPMLHFSDTRVLARLADAVILVLRAGRTTYDQALAVRQRLADDKTDILGTVLNDWTPKGNAASYYYGYRS